MAINIFETMSTPFDMHPADKPATVHVTPLVGDTAVYCDRLYLVVAQSTDQTECLVKGMWNSDISLVNSYQLSVHERNYCPESSEEYFSSTQNIQDFYSQYGTDRPKAGLHTVKYDDGSILNFEEGEEGLAKLSAYAPSGTLRAWKRWYYRS